MGLTVNSTGTALLKEDLSLTYLEEDSSKTAVVALAGNPNTGKSTVFNNLTGLKQHTGNWPGKTVAISKGQYTFNDENYVIVDLPGTYSLFADSPEEEIARDFICFSRPDVTVVVVDATCLERNLHLVLQILEITTKVVVCVNLIDEAKQKNIIIDTKKLAEFLQVEVVSTNARSGEGLKKLQEAISNVALRKEKPDTCIIRYEESLETHITKAIEILENTKIEFLKKRWLALRILDRDQSLTKKLENYFPTDQPNQLEIFSEQLFNQPLVGDFRESIVLSLYKQAEIIANTVTSKNSQANKLRFNFDRIALSKFWGIPLMLLCLGIVFWLTLVGANYPSQLLSQLFSQLEEYLFLGFNYLPVPQLVKELFILGIYRTLAWVVAVMLPPMAIFFPLFTLLEDWGLLPRIAFNLDHLFQKSGAHGKQSLTMCMGFGCNAAGVIAARIIDSPRERLLAILTNNFVPCNGRFPTLITMILLFFSGSGILASFSASIIMLLLIVGAVFVTLIVSKYLSKTVLKGIASSFTLELPPYRKPQIGKILIRSLLDRTLFVLSRAIIVAAPAGALIWFLANFGVNGQSYLEIFATFLSPLGKLMGLDGVILAAFLLGLPANEIVLPIIFMAYTSHGSLIEFESLTATKSILLNNGWTSLTAFCLMVFSLNHFPCGTTLLTIKKETGSWYWTFLSFLIPTIIGIASCIFVSQVARILSFL
ncbi:MAG TPA: ferrous iron transport protein B [Firmicutes bacterium]|nr:ferrous iron transport protein B [Bacillota bacterium]